MNRFPLLALLLAVAACSPINAFDTLVPKDGGARLAARNQAFAAGDRGKVDVYAPKGATASDKLPVIVFFYGGSWNSGSKDGYGFVGRALAAQGFVVALPDYRLIEQAAYPAFLQDGAAAVRWIRANAGRFGGDPDRIVLAGHSAGAYNAIMLSVDPQWLGRDRAAVKGLVAMAGPYSFLPLDTEVTQQTFGAVADLASTQPVNFATADDPPVLLIAGGKDHLVFGSNSVAMAMKLSEAGVPVETRVYEDLGHVGVVTALSTLFRGKAPVLKDVAAFAHKITPAPTR
ncbi:MAG: alpha/beta hydrolase [Sphingosinicella sp.]|nr:alpha/beta hydrolase [Sphingosinicella sp.]